MGQLRFCRRATVIRITCSRARVDCYTALPQTMAVVATIVPVLEQYSELVSYIDHGLGNTRLIMVLSPSRLGLYR